MPELFNWKKSLAHPVASVSLPMALTVGAATVGAVLDVFPEEAEASVSSEEVEPVLEPALEPVLELVFESVFGVVVCGVGISLPLSS